MQSGPENIAQSLMHRNCATIRNRITWFSPKFSEKISSQTAKSWIVEKMIAEFPASQ